MCILSKPLVYVPSAIEMSLFNGKTFPCERSISCPVLLSNIVEHDSALSVADVVGGRIPAAVADWENNEIGLKFGRL